MAAKMTISDIAIVIATLFGPILAVQAQKFIERSTAAQKRKVDIFTTMMSSRATTLDPGRVKAMNSIDLEFGPQKRFGINQQNSLDKQIVSAYRLYFDKLSERIDKQSSYLATWVDACANMQVDLLFLMAQRLGYNLDKAQIKRGIYHPQGHVDLENQQQEFRTRMIDLLSGKSTLPIDVKSMFIDPEMGKKQIEIQQALNDVLTGKTSISIVEKESSAVNGK